MSEDYRQDPLTGFDFSELNVSGSQLTDKKKESDRKGTTTISAARTTEAEASKDESEQDPPMRLIPLELERRQDDLISNSTDTDPTLPARWENLREEAESRDVFSVVVEKLRVVPAYHQLAKLISLAKNEGYVWVVFGQPGSGKSAFFQTLNRNFEISVLVSDIMK